MFRIKFPYAVRAYRMAKLCKRICADVFFQGFPINILSNFFAICANGDKTFEDLDFLLYFRVESNKRKKR